MLSAQARLLFLCACVPALLSGETHRVIATTYYHTFFRAHPVLKRIQPGDVVITKTLDTGGQDDNNEHRAAPGNPLTGPFYVEGAEPAMRFGFTFAAWR
jgi:hypothetical protein